MLINKYAALAIPWGIAVTVFIANRVSDDKSQDNAVKKIEKSVGLADGKRKRRKK